MYPAAHQDPRGGHNRIFVNNVFFQNWTPKMAYILGYIFADGAIEDVQKSSRTCYLSIISVDFSILEDIKHVMDSQHKLYKRLPKLNKYPDGKEYTSHEAFILRIGSKTIYNDLLNLGVTPRKSLTIPFPNIPTEFFFYFLRGYFDGDGCLHLKYKKYPLVIFTSGSLIFLQGLLTITSKLLNLPDQKIYVQQEVNRNPCYRLRFSSSSSLKILEAMYKNLEKAPFLERKYNIYKDYLALPQIYSHSLSIFIRNIFIFKTSLNGCPSGKVLLTIFSLKECEVRKIPVVAIRERKTVTKEENKINATGNASTDVINGRQKINIATLPKNEPKIE